MKKLPIILLSVFCLQFIISSCDSPTGGSTAEVVSKPSPLEPVDNATNISLTPLFKWTGSADKIEISTSTNFSSPVYAANISGQQYLMPSGKLQNNKDYFWHIGKTNGQYIDWSTTVFRFRTIP